MTNLPCSIDDLLLDRVFQPLVNRFPDAGPAGVARFLLMGSFLAGAAEKTLQFQYDGLAIGALLNLALYLLADWPRAMVAEGDGLARNQLSHL